MVSVTSASRYQPRNQSRSSMYIRGLIPRNFAELAEAVPIACEWRETECFTSLLTRTVTKVSDQIRISHPPPPPPVAWAAVRSKAVVLLLLIRHDSSVGRASASGAGSRRFESQPHHSKGTKMVLAASLLTLA